jgi:transposase
MPSDADLPDDVVTLQALLSEALASIADRDREIERLKVQIDKLKRMHFGRKSEQLDRQLDQLETQLEDLATGQGAADVRRARARSPSSGISVQAPKEALPPHLPREDRVLEPDSTCPKCGSAMRALGEDVSEQLARVTAMFKVVRTIPPASDYLSCYLIPIDMVRGR